MISLQNHVFIDTENCGSSIGYHISVSEFQNKRDGKTEYSTQATVVLADCSHKIDWGFDDSGLEKIDAAISMLHEFRKKFADTIKTVSKLNK